MLSFCVCGQTIIIMKQIAQVEIISANNLDVFKWLRKNMDWLNIKEAKEKSSQKIIDFDGDYEE